MSVENRPAIISEPDFGGRKEYNQTTAERLASCLRITDAIDSILTISPGLYGAGSTTVECNADGTCIKWAYEHVVMTGPSAAEETEITIQYSRTRAPRKTREHYNVIVDTFIGSKGIRNTYDMEYFGANRTSAMSILTAGNFVEDEQPDTVTRDTTPYDQRQLYDALMELQDVISAGDQELSTLARLHTTPE